MPALSRTLSAESATARFSSVHWQHYEPISLFSTTSTNCVGTGPPPVSARSQHDWTLQERKRAEDLFEIHRAQRYRNQLCHGELESCSRAVSSGKQGTALWVLDKAVSTPPWQSGRVSELDRFSDSRTDRHPEITLKPGVPRIIVGRIEVHPLFIGHGTAPA